MSTLNSLFPPEPQSPVEFKSAADESPALIWLAGLDGLCIWFNKGWLEFTGRSLAQELGNGWVEGLHPDDSKTCLDQYLRHVNAREQFLTEYRLRRHDGQYRWILDSGMPYYDAEGNFLGYKGVCFDITQRKDEESDIRIAAVAFETQHAMIVTDANKTIIRANKAFTTLTGYSTEETINSSPSMLSSGRHDADFYTELWKAIALSGFWHGEIWNRCKGGNLFPVLLTITAVKDSKGITTHYIGSFSDLSQRIAEESKLRDLAFYDPLTSLANRRLLLDRLETAFTKSTRSGNHGALIFIDLDDFKQVNDQFGHPVGDKLLELVASRLHLVMREEDTIARFGGDEFVVLLENLETDANEAKLSAIALAEKIRLTLNAPYKMNTTRTIQWKSTVSIGVSLFLGQEHSIQDILTKSDSALYKAKESGKNKVHFLA